MQSEYKIKNATYIVSRSFVEKKSVFDQMFTYIASETVKNKLTKICENDTIKDVSGLPMEDK